MGCTFKTVFYVNGSKERNGIVPIMGRVTINGTIAQFSCKQSVTKILGHTNITTTQIYAKVKAANLTMIFLSLKVESRGICL